MTKHLSSTVVHFVSLQVEAVVHTAHEVTQEVKQVIEAARFTSLQVDA